MLGGCKTCQIFAAPQSGEDLTTRELPLPCTINSVEIGDSHAAIRGEEVFAVRLHPRHSGVGDLALFLARADMPLFAMGTDKPWQPFSTSCLPTGRPLHMLFHLVPWLPSARFARLSFQIALPA